MAYDPTVYVNDSAPDIDADNLNKAEQGIKAAADAAAAAQSTANAAATKESVDALTTEVGKKADKTDIPSIAGLAKQTDLDAAIARIKALEDAATPPTEG